MPLDHIFYPFESRLLFIFSSTLHKKPGRAGILCLHFDKGASFELTIINILLCC